MWLLQTAKYTGHLVKRFQQKAHVIFLFTHQNYEWVSHTPLLMWTISLIYDYHSLNSWFCVFVQTPCELSMEELSIIIILHWKQRVGQFVCCSRKSDVLSLYLDRSTLFTFHEFTLVEPSVYSVFSFYLHLTLSMVLPLMFLNPNHLRFVFRNRPKLPILASDKFRREIINTIFTLT